MKAARQRRAAKPTSGLLLNVVTVGLACSATLMTYTLMSSSSSSHDATEKAVRLSQFQEHQTQAMMQGDDGAPTSSSSPSSSSLSASLKTTGINLLERVFSANAAAGKPAIGSSNDNYNDEAEEIASHANVTARPITMVDALGRPLSTPATFHSSPGLSLIEEDMYPPAVAGGEEEGAAPASPPASPSQPTDEAEWKQALQERAEAECLALLMADSQSSPAEPSTLIACRAVLLTKTKREFGDKLYDALLVDGKEAAGDGDGNGGHNGDGGDAAPPPPPSSGLGDEFDRRHFATALLSPLPGSSSSSSIPSSASATAAATMHAPASLRNEVERCLRVPNDEAPPVLLWRAKRTGGATLAALL